MRLPKLLGLPDTFDPDDRRRRQILNIILALFIAGGLVSIIATFSYGDSLMEILYDQDGLNIHHIPDTEFMQESGDMTHKPAAEQYNNLTLIGGQGFHPTPTSDVVLQFSSRASENFYGTAGVILQPLGTLSEDGVFAGPFDMFGFSIAGEESSIQGINGGLCYLALNWMPVKVSPLPVDVHSWQIYEIRLRWMSRTKWLGSMSVDGKPISEMSLPAFGPIEVHVWSDNSLVLHRPRRWWEIAPSMDLKFQDGGDKEFSLGRIQIFSEAR